MNILVFTFIYSAKISSSFRVVRSPYFPLYIIQLYTKLVFIRRYDTHTGQKHKLMVRAMVDPEPFVGILGAGQKYTLDGTSAHVGVIWPYEHFPLYVHSLC